MNTKKMSGKRIGMIIIGAILLLAFFFLAVYHNSLMSVAGMLTGLMGMGGGASLGELANITSLKLIIAAISSPTELTQIGLNLNSMVVILIHGLTLAAIICIIVFAIIGKKTGAIGALVASATTTLLYIVQMFGLSGMAKIAGYGVSFWQYIKIILAIVVIILAVLELKAVNQEAQYAGYDDGNWGGYGMDNTYYNGQQPGGWDGQNGGGYDGYGGYGDQYGGYGDQYGNYGDQYGYDGYDQQGAPAGGLIGLKGEYKGAVLPIPDGTRITIGRNAEGCNLVISDPAVSRIHCHVTYFADKGVYGVTDVSRHGVYDTRGNQIEKDKMIYMGPGDEIHIGMSHNVFRLQ